jgi:hypothetical protein
MQPRSDRNGLALVCKLVDSRHPLHLREQQRVLAEFDVASKCQHAVSRSQPGPSAGCWPGRRAIATDRLSEGPGLPVRAGGAGASLKLEIFVTRRGRSPSALLLCDTWRRPGSSAEATAFPLCRPRPWAPAESKCNRPRECFRVTAATRLAAVTLGWMTPKPAGRARRHFARRPVAVALGDGVCKPAKGLGTPESQVPRVTRACGLVVRFPAERTPDASRIWRG